MQTPSNKPKLDSVNDSREAATPKSWHASERDQVLIDLGTSPEAGLSQ